jgi:hypothetical protein
MKNYNPFKFRMNKLWLIITVSLNAGLFYAQSASKTNSFTTVKEVVDAYYKAIGLKDHPNSKVFSSQEIAITKNNGGKDGVTKSIAVTDYDKETVAGIYQQKLFGKTNTSRMVCTKEKNYMFMDNGETIETASTSTPETFKNPFTAPTDYDENQDAKLLPREMFDGQEVNVVQVNKQIKLSGSSSNIIMYQYYSASNNLLIASKSELTVTINMPGMDKEMESKSVDITRFQDYRLVDNMLLPHKHIIEGSGLVNGVNSTLQTVSVLKYNIDVEHFKSVTFKNAEKAMAEIPDEL